MKYKLRTYAIRIKNALKYGRNAGFVDEINDRMILGWAMQGNLAATDINIEIDGVIAGKAVAGLYRDDLRAAGYANGRCGFSYRFPQSLDDGEQHIVRVLVGSSARPLPLSSDARRTEFPLTFRMAPDERSLAFFEPAQAEHLLGIPSDGLNLAALEVPPLEYTPYEPVTEAEILLPPDAAAEEAAAAANIDYEVVIDEAGGSEVVAMSMSESVARIAEAGDYLPAFCVYYSLYGAQFSFGNDYDLFAVDRRPLPITQHPVSVDFIGQGAEITDVGFHFATYMRHNRCTIEATLGMISERTGEFIKIAHRTIQPETLTDNALKTIGFVGVPLQPGRRYRLQLASPDAHEDNYFAVWSVSPTRAQQFSHRFLGAARGGRFSPAVAHGKKLSVAAVFCNKRSDLPAVCDYLQRLFPDTPLDIVVLDGLRNQYPELVRRDIVVFCNFQTMPYDARAGFDHLAFALHKAGVFTVSLETNSALEPWNDALLRLSRNIQHSIGLHRQFRRRCHAMITLDDAGKAKMESPLRPDLKSKSPDAALLKEMAAAFRKSQQPSVEIVTVLYKKVDVAGDFLRMVGRQSYNGPIRVTFVDDCSPDDSADVVERWSASNELKLPANVSVAVLRNKENIGNCGSRNRGIANSTADILIVMDCDCLINRDFIASHVFEHWFSDVDVVIGPLNIETNGRPGIELVQRLEAEPSLLASEAGLQDDIVPNGFLNCITRNFSVKRSFLKGQPLFDEDFAYSNKPNTGFGWEDIEMGYRLYSQGARIAFTEEAFSVHVSHASSVPEQRKVLGSMRNFNLMFNKHPELELASRRWSTETVQRIFQWADNSGVERNQDREELERRFSKSSIEIAPFLQAWKSKGRRLRILSYRWHVAHQYELYKLPHDFTLVTGIGNSMCETWDYESRPLRPNVRFRHVSEIDPNQYDLAILHFDENVLAPHYCNNTIPSDWGAPVTYFRENFRIPSIGLCHGTPQFVGQYGLNPDFISDFEIYDEERRRLVEFFADIPVICNSHQAQMEWQFKRSLVIWHGFDPQEFPPTKYPGGVLTLGGPATERPHYRGVHHMQRIRDLLPDDIRIGTVSHEDGGIRPRGTNRFSAGKFRRYVDRIRDYSVYLNTTIRSPMPRSRGEAMMCGLVPVSMRNHDVDHFIRNGVNGFYSDSAAELAEYVAFLSRNEEATRRMGQQARLTAMDVFNNDRYLSAWTRLIEEVVG